MFDFVKKHKLRSLVAFFIIFATLFVFWQNFVLAVTGWQQVRDPDKWIYVPDNCFPTVDSQGHQIAAAWVCHYHTITTSEAWQPDPDGRPHVVIGNLTVTNNAALTINIGDIWIYHTVDLFGTPQPSGITVSRGSTVTAACDFGGSGSAHEHGCQFKDMDAYRWNGIFVGDVALLNFDNVKISNASTGIHTEMDAQSVVKNSEIYGGNLGVELIAAGSWVSGSYRINQTRIENCDIHNNASHGILLKSNGGNNPADLAALIKDGGIHDNGGSGVYVAGGAANDAIRPIIDNVDIYNNQNGIYVAESGPVNSQGNHSPDLFEYNTALMLIRNSQIHGNRDLAFQLHPGTILGTGNLKNDIYDNGTAHSGTKNVIRFIGGDRNSFYLNTAYFPSTYAAYYPGYPSGYRDPLHYEWYDYTSQPDDPGQKVVMEVAKSVYSTESGNRVLDINSGAVVKFNGGAELRFNFGRFNIAGVCQSGDCDPSLNLNQPDDPGNVFLISLGDSARGGDTSWAESQPVAGNWKGVYIGSQVGYDNNTNSTKITRARIENAVTAITISSGVNFNNLRQINYSVISNCGAGISFYGVSGPLNIQIFNNLIKSNSGQGIAGELGDVGYNGGAIIGEIKNNLIAGNQTGMTLKADAGNGQLVLSVNNNNFTANSGDGFYLSEQGHPDRVMWSEVVNNAFTGNGRLAMQIYPLMALSDDLGNNFNKFHGNGVDGVNVVKVLPGVVDNFINNNSNPYSGVYALANSLSYKRYWGGGVKEGLSEPAVFAVSGLVEFRGDSNKVRSLKVNYGNALKFYPGAKLLFHPLSQLDAKGENKNVIFTSIYDNNALGDTSWATIPKPANWRWNGVASEYYVDLKFDNVILRQATTGIDAHDNGGLSLLGSEVSDNSVNGVNSTRNGSDSSYAALTITGSKIINNGQHGVQLFSNDTCYGGINAYITNTEISGNGQNGIYIPKNTAKINLSISGSTPEANLIQNNGLHGIYYVDGGSCDPVATISQTKIFGNGSDGIRIFNVKKDKFIVANSSIYGNGAAEINNLGKGSQYQVTAINNWWGTGAGPYDSSDTAAEPKNTCGNSPNDYVTDYVSGSDSYWVKYNPWQGLAVPSAPSITKIDNKTVFPAQNITLNPAIQATVAITAFAENIDWIVCKFNQPCEFEGPAPGIVWRSNSSYCPSSLPGSGTTKIYEITVDKNNGSFTPASFDKLEVKTHYLVKVRLKNRLGNSAGQAEFFTGSGQISDAWFKAETGNIYAQKGLTLTQPENDVNAAYCVFASSGSLGLKLQPNPDLANCRTNTFDILQRFQGADYYSPSFGSLDVQGTISRAAKEQRLVSKCAFSGPLNLGGKVYLCQGDAHISASSLIYQAGKKGNGLIIVMGGNLYLDGDISYLDSAGSDVAGLPSLGIMVLKGDVADPLVAGNLVVKGAVGAAVGAYYVDGSVYSCHLAPGTVDTDCSKQLVISGLLSARQFELKREFSDNGPAEKIIYDGRVLANTPPGMTNLIKGLPSLANQ